MRFYDTLQLDPAVLKSKMRTAESPKEKRKFIFSMILRSFLIVSFSIIFIASLSAVFGPENNAMCVVLFCILLSVRFVDFGYCIKDSLINLAVVFFVLLIAPSLAAQVHPIVAVFIHFIAFLTIVVMTSDLPELGNGGLCGFSYVFLSGNPVSGVVLQKRAMLTLVGFIICGTIFFFKHYKKNKDIRFRQILSNFHLCNDKCRWQFRFALGVSLLLSFGQLFHLQRFMWAGFAGASLLSNFSSSVSDVKQRFFHRMIGCVVGCSLFFIVYQMVPASFHTLLGPLSGFCLGFCTDYRYKTAVNCFGALLLATGIYGLTDSVCLRVFNNLLGVAFSTCFFILFNKLIDQPLKAKKENVICCD